MSNQSALDFIYEVEKKKGKVLKEAKKRPGRGWLDPQKVKQNSYVHIAMNIFRSVFPFGFDEKAEASNKLNQLRGRVWNRVKQFSKKTGLSEEQLQNEIMNPNSELGKEILRKVDVNAKLVGLNGQLVDSWTEDLWKPLEGGSESEEIASAQKQIEIKPEDQPFGQEDIEGVTGFVTKVIKSAKDAGFLSQIPSASDVDMTDPEFAYSGAVKYLIDALAFQAADIAIRGLIEYELLNYGKEDDTDDLSDKKFQDYIKGDEGFGPIMAKIGEIFSTSKSGVRLLDDTVKKYQKQILKIADEALTDAGFDEELPEEIEFFTKMMQKEDSKPYLYSANVKKALDSAAEQISNMLSNDDQFVQSLTDNIMNREDIQKALIEAEPELEKKIADIQARNVRVSSREKEEQSSRLKKKKELISRLQALQAKGFQAGANFEQALDKPGLDDQALDNIATHIEDLEAQYGIESSPVQEESFRSFYEKK